MSKRPPSFSEFPSRRTAAQGVPSAVAADVDVSAAYYLDQIHYATKGAAWMLAPDRIALLGVRDCSCGTDSLACRVRVKRERTHVILHLPRRALRVDLAREAVFRVAQNGFVCGRARDPA